MEQFGPDLTSTLVGGVDDLVATPRDTLRITAFATITGNRPMSHCPLFERLPCFCLPLVHPAAAAPPKQGREITTTPEPLHRRRKGLAPPAR